MSMSYLESLDSWILQIFAIVLFVATINLLVRFVARQFVAKAKKTNNVWDDAFAQNADDSFAQNADASP